MRWAEITIRTTEDAADAISEMLAQVGADGIAQTDPYEFRRTIEEDPLSYCDDGTIESYGTDVIIKAYFAELDDGFIRMGPKSEEFIDPNGVGMIYGGITDKTLTTDEALEYISKAENARAGGAEIYDNRLLRVRVYAENNLLPDALLVIHGLMEKYPQEALDIYYDGATVLFDFSYFETVVAMLMELEAQSEVVNPNLYAILAYSEMSLGHHENALKNIRKAVEAHASSLADLFADKFPNVKVEELYDYYYYQVYGHWPK